MSVAAQDMRDELNWSENEKGLVLVRYPQKVLSLKAKLDLVFLLLGLFSWTNPCLLVNSKIWSEMDLRPKVNNFN